VRNQGTGGRRQEPGVRRQEGREAGKPGSREAGRLGGWKAGRLEGWEAGRLGGWEVGRLRCRVAFYIPPKSCRHVVK